MIGCFLQLTRATDQNRPGVENSRRSTAWSRAASGAGAPRRAAWRASFTGSRPRGLGRHPPEGCGQGHQEDLQHRPPPLGPSWRSTASASPASSPRRTASELASTRSARLGLASSGRGGPSLRQAIPDLQEDASTRKEAGVLRTAGTRRCPARQRPKGWTVNEIPSTLGSLPTVGSRSYGPY